MKAICLGCGKETETPWQCACGWRRMPTQEDVDLLQRNLAERLGLAREERRRVIEHERRHQQAERGHAEWRQKEHARLLQEAEQRDKEWREKTERIKAEQREARRREAERVLGEWLREEATREEAERIQAEAKRIEAEAKRQEALRAQRAARATAAKRDPRHRTLPKPDLYAAEPLSPLLEQQNYRRALTALNLSTESRFFEQRNLAAHRHFEKLAAELAQFLPEPRYDEFWEVGFAHSLRHARPKNDD